MSGLTHEEAHIRAPKPGAMMHLAERSDARGLVQLAIHLGLLLLTGTLVAVLPGWWKAPAIMALGVVQAALFAPFHETMHQTAFATRRLNAIVGWLAGAPSFFNWHFYQSYHLAHHRHTQDPERDPELSIQPPPARIGNYLLRLTTIPYWRSRFRIAVDGLRGDYSAYPYIHPDAAPRIIRSVRLMVAFVLGMALLAGVTLGWQAVLLFWVLPQLFGQCMLRCYLLTEHTLCSNDRDGLTNTRTMLTNPVMRLLMWNMPYHAEHHLYPFIPFHRLAEAHEVVKGRLTHVHPGYVNWHRRFVGLLRTGGAAP
ncbi:fatty acid desaturase [Rhodovarius crocodyli]|uniref:Fatty acid desaturase n=1 Tax=Rhodovarius crocodyli TaxID=1979269 RepID=A0A437M3H1_9PROT|nr:fatty acid desaturase [Rhodovarius crocodyli]RVT92249.1 fatty acid desaturase [Rhodovarius crocodyli]